MVGLRDRLPLGSARRLAAWSPRRWAVAALAATATILVVAVPTALIPNPVFGREIAPTAWSWPVLLVTAVLSGLLTATYVRTPAMPTSTSADGEAPADDGAPGDRAGLRDGDAPTDDRSSPVSRAGAVGGLLTFFAVGCPVCNKVALLALGYAGAMQWFAPIQPWLAAAGVGLLAYALVRRLDGERRCPLPRSATAARPGSATGAPRSAAAPSTSPSSAAGPVRSSAASASRAASPPSQ